MTGFEFLFTLFSLVLGLALTEILSGLGRSLEYFFASRDKNDGRQFRIGWLTPLLGVFVILDLLSFWASAWSLRDVIAISSSAMLGVVAFSSAYFLAARMVFPSEPDNFVDLDQHFFRVRKLVLGILLLLVCAQYLYYLTIPSMAEAVHNPFVLGMTLVLAALMLAAMFVRQHWLNLLTLVLLCLRYLVVYLLN
jgi:hypothetical protein